MNYKSFFAYIKKKFMINDQKIAQLVSLPTLILVLLLVVIPIILIIWSSFRDISLSQLFGTKFVGFDNYIVLFRSKHFWQATRTTVIFSSIVVALSYILGMASAIMLNKPFFLKGIIFVAIMLPWAMPHVPAALIWKWMINTTFGVLNWFLVDIGVIAQPIAWLSDSRLALIVVIVVSIWHFFPLAFMMSYAALQTIPNELYEAARIDGAQSWQELIYITLPSIRNISNVLIIILMLFSFRAVSLIIVLTGGGPRRATETLTLQTYIEAFQNYNLDSASAVGVVTLIMIFSVTSLYKMFVMKGEK